MVNLFVKMQSSAFTHREIDCEYRLSEQSVNSAPDLLPSVLIPLLFVPIISLTCLVQATVNCRQDRFKFLSLSFLLLCVFSSQRAHQREVKTSALTTAAHLLWASILSLQSIFCVLIPLSLHPPPKPVAYGEPLQSAAPGLPPLDTCGGYPASVDFEALGVGEQLETWVQIIKKLLT